MKQFNVLKNDWNQFEERRKIIKPSNSDYVDTLLSVKKITHCFEYDERNIFSFLFVLCVVQTPCKYFT